MSPLPESGHGPARGAEGAHGRRAEEPNRPGWITALGLSALLALLATIPCWPVLLAGQTFYYRDIHAWFIPQRALVAAILRAGHLPTWDPFLYGGTALWANPNNIVAHPTTLAYVLMPAGLAFGVGTALHLALAAVGTFLLARRLTLSREAAFVGGTAFALSGVMLSLVNLHPLLLSLAPLPLLLWAWDGWIGGGSPRLLAVVSGLAALVALGVGTEASLSGAALVLLWTLVAPGPRRLATRIPVLAGCGVTALMVSAPGWLPAMGILHGSPRAGGFPWAAATCWSLHPARLPEILVPGLLGRFSAMDPGAWWGAAIEGEPTPLLVSIAVGPLVAALVALGSLRCATLPRSLRRVFIALFAMSIVLALGRHLPGSGLAEAWGIRLPLRHPVKFLELGALPLALLAASGVDVVRNAASWPRVAVRAGVVLLAAAGVLAILALLPVFAPDASSRWFGAWFHLPSPGSFPGLATSFGSAALEALLGALLVGFAPRLGPRLTGVVLAIAVAASLLRSGIPVNPLAPGGALTGEPPLVPIVRRVVGEGRLYRPAVPERVLVPTSTNDVIDDVLFDRAGLAGNAATQFGIPLAFAGDVDGLAPEREELMTRFLTTLPWDRRLPLLRSAGVRAVLTNEDARAPGLSEVWQVEMGGGIRRVFAVEGAASTARFVPRSRFASSDQEAIDALTDPTFDPTSEVIIVGRGSPQATTDCSGRVVPPSIAMAPGQDFDVDAGCDGVVVLAIPYQSGIEAEIDGRPAAVFPADIVSCGIAVPAGHHALRWRYRMRTLWSALALSASGLAIVAVMALRRPRRLETASAQ